MTVRPARPEDLSRLLPFARRIFDLTFSPTNDALVMKEYMDKAFTPERISEEYAEPDSLYLIAWEGDDIMGYARLRRNSEVDDQLGTSHFELQRFYLDPAVQGRGHAAVLFHHCLLHCKEVRWLWLGVWEHNPRAIRFYEKNGFEKFGEHVFRMGDEDQIDWLMRKRLLPGD